MLFHISHWQSKDTANFFQSKQLLHPTAHATAQGFLSSAFSHDESATLYLSFPVSQFFLGCSQKFTAVKLQKANAIEMTNRVRNLTRQNHYKHQKMLS